ncbi:MAG: nitroreductase family protein [Syntrophobacterales bacterium]|nr:MAG: nitroreductase family protein [Syntrophobacterales bacterium]
MSSFEELLKKRRAIRNFEERNVPLPLIQEIIRESTFAPSASHGQPWYFIIINNRDVMKRLSDECKRSLLARIEANPKIPLSGYKTALENTGFNIFYNAPCMVYIVGHAEAGSLDVDCALLASYLMFSAAQRGLGTCWVGLGAHIDDPGIRQEIGLSKVCRIVAPIIIGYPGTIPEPLPREEPKILKIVS